MLCYAAPFLPQLCLAYSLHTLLKVSLKARYTALYFCLVETVCTAACWLQADFGKHNIASRGTGNCTNVVAVLSAEAQAFANV